MYLTKILMTKYERNTRECCGCCRWRENRVRYKYEWWKAVIPWSNNDEPTWHWGSPSPSQPPNISSSENFAYVLLISHLNRSFAYFSVEPIVFCNTDTCKTSSEKCWEDLRVTHCGFFSGDKDCVWAETAPRIKEKSKATFEEELILMNIDYIFL